MPAVYSIDLIAKRDKKIKMDRSIVKGWNVHYQTLEEVEDALRFEKQKQEEAQEQEGYDRLEGEAQSDEAEQVQEMEDAVEVQNSKDAFNAKTRSYSGHYGKKPIQDEEKKQKVHAILNEKPDAYSSAMSVLQSQEGMADEE